MFTPSLQIVRLDLNQTTLGIKPKIGVFVGNQREDSVTRQAIKGTLTITSPLHKTVVGCGQHRTVRIYQYLRNSRVCVLEGEDLHLIVSISSQTTLNQAQPQTALRIRCEREDVQSLV